MDTEFKEKMAPDIGLISYNSAKHLNQLTKWLQDDTLMHGWGMQPFATKDEVNVWANDPTRIVLMVLDIQNNNLVGMVNFYEWDKEKKVASRGTLIDPKYQNRGFGKASILASNKYAFNQMGLERIELYVKVDNAVSRHITEKLGYKFDRHDPRKDEYYYFMEKPTDN